MTEKMKENKNLMEKRWAEIKRWEKRLEEKKKGIRKKNQETTFLPLKMFLEGLDRLIVHTNSIMLHPRFYEETKKNILYQARMFGREVSTVGDLQKLPFQHLHYIHKTYMANHRLVSLGQGGITGTGGFLSFAADFPAALFLNLHTVQISAMCYGYDLRKPYEMMITVKVFQSALMPSTKQKDAWDDLNKGVFPEKEELLWLYEGSEITLHSSLLHHNLRQLVKLLVLYALTKRGYKSLAPFRLAAGALYNYQLTKGVSEWAGYFYEKRYLKDIGYSDF